VKPKTYYHGTNPRNLYGIITQGFKLLGEESHGRVHGAGLYIATKPETAAYWADQAFVHRAHYAIKCQVQEGTRVLWKETDYDKKVIRSLEKEFGKGISRNYDFWKLIPHNKQLTTKELRALVTHLDYAIGYAGWGTKKTGRESDKKYAHLKRFSRLLRQYGYDALGDRTESCWDSDEILVYNPSRVIPVSVHRLNVVWERDKWEPTSVDYSHPLPLDEIKKISEEEEADWQKWEAEYDAEEIARKAKEA
jgi:hypothetical protein